MQTIENPYIAVEIQDHLLSLVRRTVQSSLIAAGLVTEAPERSAHVSLGYGMGEERAEDLQRLAERIASIRIELRVKGVEIVRGLTTPFDYVVLALEENEAFRRARVEIENELTTKNMPGGFHAHVTLLRVPKEKNAAEMSAGLRSRLEHVTRDDFGTLCVCGEKLAVFDGQKCCRIERRMTA